MYEIVPPTRLTIAGAPCDAAHSVAICRWSRDVRGIVAGSGPDSKTGYRRENSANGGTVKIVGADREVTEIAVSNSDLTERDLTEIGELKHLERLSLRLCPVRDDWLRHLEGLGELHTWT